VTDAGHNVLRGDIQYFGMHGEVPREVVIVSDGRGKLGYDLWGNQIYSRRTINTSSSHESFNAYYNNAIPPGFNTFQDSFSQGNFTSPDNQWKAYNGTWLVKNGAYNGTWTSGPDGNVFVWSDIGKGDLSVQASIYITNNRTGNPVEFQRIGIFTHYPGNGGSKWSLVLHTWSGGTFLELVNDPTQRQANLGDPAFLGNTYTSAQTRCPITVGTWYNFRMTVAGSQAIGTVTIPSQNVSCSVSGTFPSGPATAGTGFGLYSGGFSALFGNVTATTVDPFITGSRFSNSFIGNGAPGPSIHGAMAGSAEFQNANGYSVETYYGYVPWGGLGQTRQLYTPPSGGAAQWLTISRTYDAYGNLKVVTDPRGNQTSYGYSPTYQSAYLTSVNQTLVPGGTLISKSYSYNFTTGTMLTSVDPNGQTTSYQYDILGRTTQVAYPGGGATIYSYSDSGNYVNTTTENGWKTRRVYDGLGRLSSLQRVLNVAVYSNETYRYDWQNKVTSTVDPVGNVYTSLYDPLGRTTKTTKPDGNVTQVFYNDTASWIRYTDETQLNFRCNFYDRLGQLIGVVEYAYSDCSPIPVNTFFAYVANYYYDEVGNLRQTATNSLSQSTVYNYDSLNRLMQTSYPDSTSESYTYDADSNLVGKVDRNGNQTGYVYDSLNRVTTITYRGKTATSDAYTYDAAGNLLRLQSQNATLWYTYDSRNRVTCESYGINGVSRSGVSGPCSTGGASPVAMSTPTPGGISVAGYSFSYTYQGAVMTSIAYNDFLVANYAYDGLGRLVDVTVPATYAITYYARFSYYPNNEMKGVQYSNGLIGNYTYDKLSRTSSITLKNGGTTLISLAYGYGNTGTVVSVTGQVNGATVSEQYLYDPLQRLTNSTVQSQGAATTLWYQNDIAGNRVSQSVNNLPTSYTYNLANNVLTKWSTSNGASSVYSYDKNGNLLTQNLTTTSGTTHWTYGWDVPGHLLKVANYTSVQGYYAYDGLGRRMEAKEGSTVTFYAYRGTETLADGFGSGVLNYDYIYAGGLRIAKVKGGGTVSPSILFYHNDALGSTRLETSSNGSVLFSDGYQPYGQDNGTRTGSETYKFTGKPVSATTGLYYYYQRWYDPSIGRFISPDPRHGKLSNPQSLNLYIYVLDRPTGLIDPKGEWGWDPFQAASNWWNGLSSDQRQFIVEAVVAVAVVAVVVATGGAALPVVLAAGVAGGAINVGVTVGSKLATGQQVSLSDVGHSFLQGFIVGAATAGIAGGISALRAGGEAANLAEFSAARGGITYKASQYLLGKGLSRIESAFGTDSEGALSLLKNTVEGGSLTPESNVAGRITIRSLADIGIGNAGPRTPFAVLEPDTGEIVNFYPKPFTQSVLNFLGLDI
jgi:RHS repeat-associated protein